MDFRAFNGPVSLKRMGGGGVHGCGSYFRAFNGPVSLKLACGDEKVDGVPISGPSTARSH